ncbi:replication factor C subunit [Achlya hypogyna]|uniref:Replication factor C subunit 1 n=1 Tax=Achlya hypogyna TaxID=1202772 RepID=A0A1V9YZF6_ACHHY|nr:replication factor C subunit [Achlya hypogyna]
MDIRSFFSPKSGGAAKPPTETAKPTKSPVKPKKEPVPARARKAKNDATDDGPSRPASRAGKSSRKVIELDSDSDIEEVQPAKKPKAAESPKKESTAKAAPLPVAKPVKETTTKATAKANNTASNDVLILPKGKVRVPEGKPGCLEGLTFAFSGVLSSLTRGEAEAVVKRYGGSVAGSVTRNTKYLVTGELLENGDSVTESSKFKDAVAKSIKILNQNDFFNLISERAERLVPKASAGKGKAKLGTTAPETMLWPDKHKPKSMNDIIGNGELGKRLVQWLRDFDAVHVKGTKKVPFNPKMTDNMGAKTVLLSGPPGIGKTTLAALAARECGMDVLELNASDARSKKTLQSGLADIVGTQALAFGGKAAMGLTKRVIVMDEVDGMSSGDRGGMAELIAIIKKSKTPIVCICNDRQSPKVRSLANYALDLKFRRPTKSQIATRLLAIGAAQGMQCERNALEEAAERFGNDIRQLLNWMQMWNRSKTTMTYDDVVAHFYQSEKDDVLRLNPFSATQQIFKNGATFDDRNEAYFVDYDLMPLMVQENYIASIQSKRTSSDDKLDDITAAADMIAESDLVSVYIRKEQRWDLLTKQAALNVAACTYAEGFVSRPEFSRWMGKNSSTNKAKRLLSELSIRMRSHASGARNAIRMDYVPYMKEVLLTRLLAGEESMDGVIDMLDACEISKDDLTESMEHFKFPGVVRKSYAELDTKAKSAFTRKYNKGVHKSQALVEANLAANPAKKRTSKKATDDGDDGDDDGLMADDGDEADDDDVSQFQKKASAKPAAAKRKGKEPAGSAPKRARAPAKKK